jgi:transposase
VRFPRATRLPLYRQAQIFARQGITLDRSTLCNWVGRACWWLEPLHELMLNTVLASPRVFADDTPLPVLDPGRGRTKTGRLWCYAVDNRPWCGPGHPVVAYLYSEDRKAQHPAAHLKGFRGLLQVDGYAGFGRLVRDAGDEAPQLAFCWTHTRRKFFDIPPATNRPSQPRRCSASPHCMRSRPRSAVVPPRSGGWHGRAAAGR